VCEIPKYHPRQWVDISGTAYKGERVGWTLLSFFFLARDEEKE